MRYTIFIFLSVFCILMHGQTTYNMEILQYDGNIENFLIKNIDSITYEYDNTSQEYIQKNWINLKSYNYPISNIDHINIVKTPVKYTTNLNIEGTIASVLTTYGDYAYTFKDTISNNGYLTVFGNLDSEDLLYVKLDSFALIRTIWSKSCQYFIEYNNDSIIIANIDTLDNTCKTIKTNISSIAIKDSLDRIDTGWPKFCRLIKNIIQQDTLNFIKDKCYEPIVRISSLADSITIPTSIYSNTITTKNRTFIGDLLFIMDFSNDVASLYNKNIVALIKLLNAMDELAQRLHRFLYLGWWDVIALPAENITVKSATLPCEISGFNPIGKWFNITQCTMYLYEAYEEVIPFKTQTIYDISQTGKYSFEFTGLKANSLYTYKPILTASYYENIGGIANYTVNDLFINGTYIPPVQPIWHKEVQIDGIPKSFKTSIPTANTGNVFDITDKSAKVKCTYANIPEDGICGVEISWNSSSTKQTSSNINGTHIISLDGLKPNTTYTYCAYVETNGTTYYGENKTFTTSLPNISGTWTCTEEFYRFTGALPSYKTYSLILNSDGSANCSEYNEDGSWNFNSDGTITINIMLIATQTQNSGIEWFGKVDNIENPTKITGGTYNWNFNQFGYFQGNTNSVIITR